MGRPRKIIPETDEAVFARLLPGLKPRNPVELEMGRRYVKWFRLFEREEAIVERDGSTIEHPNGTSGQSPHFINMRHAEGEMRRLWDKLSKVADDAQADTKVVPGFEGL